MEALHPHWSFVIAAYAITCVVLAGLAIGIVLDLRRQRRLLADLEAEGTRRRARAATTG